MFCFTQNFTIEEIKEIERISELVKYLMNVNTYGPDAAFPMIFELIGLQTTKDPDAFLHSMDKELSIIFNELSDQKLTANANEDFEIKKQILKASFQSTDQNMALAAYLLILWYTKLPCFDIDGITSEVDGEKAVLKFCMWKGRAMPCSAIFKKVATDVGICCAFNMEEADKLFVTSRYTTIITNLQEEEKKLAFPSILDTDWYTTKNEPISQAGTTMGLTIILDAHTDKITESTVDSDLLGFEAVVIPPGDFPITSINQFYIKPGQSNSVAMTAIKLKADEDIRDITPKKRNCYFQDETENVKLHLKYSQSNCLIECSLRYVQKLHNNTLACTPWFFPFLNEDHRMCDPWEKNAIFEKIHYEVPVDACDYCLPDCNRVIYQPIFSTQKFRECDEKNFGMSKLCNLEAYQIQPQIWGKQVLDQLVRSKGNMTKLQEKIQSSQREILPIYFPGYIFTNLTRLYNAYEKDIAVLNVFFASPTVMEYTTKPSKTWVDFISAVGGNGGLFIGFSIVTVLELFWLLLRIGNYYLEPYHL